jgi:tetratricopeptide (TPR) repeat protein
MRALERALRETLIDASSDARFNSPKNFKRIEANAQALAKLAHGLEKKNAAPDADPSIQIFSQLFAQEADEAHKMLKIGQRTYARSILRALPGYCIACHTRNATGPQFEGIWDSPEVAQLGSLEKANYLAATRMFDKALDQYEQIISSPKMASTRPFEWEKAVRSALAIAVRVKKDPDRAGAVVDRTLETKGGPFFVREQAIKWKESVKQWKEELPRQPKTEEGLYSEAVRLIAAAKSAQKYPADRSADVIYLRASATLHDLLSAAPGGPRAADALYLAGVSYEVLQGLNFWDLHEFYYLACIKQAPHSEVSRNCFNNLEESVYAGYTGSAGTDLPPELEFKLQELEKLSRPAEAPKRPQ